MFRSISILLLCLLIVGYTYTSLKPKFKYSPSLEIWVLNVGQGESILIREPGGKKILYDGGPNDTILTEIGNILPVWDRTIDLLILSHNHSDHIRGLIPVLQRYKVAGVWISGATHTTGEFRAFQQELKNQQLAPETVSFNPKDCMANLPQCPPQNSFGKAFLQIYHPLKNMVGVHPKNQHDATVIVKVTYQEKSILLTGDLNEIHETSLIRACPRPTCSLAANLLQIPHHGSASGLIPEFLAAVSPQVALISVGKDNSFNHPRPEIITRLLAAKIPIYRTDMHGRILIAIFNEKDKVITTVQTENSFVPP